MHKFGNVFSALRFERRHPQRHRVEDAPHKGVVKSLPAGRQGACATKISHNLWNLKLIL